MRVNYVFFSVSPPGSEDGDHERLIRKLKALGHHLEFRGEVQNHALVLEKSIDANEEYDNILMAKEVDEIIARLDENLPKLKQEMAEVRDRLRRSERG